MRSLVGSIIIIPFFQSCVHPYYGSTSVAASSGAFKERGVCKRARKGLYGVSLGLYTRYLDDQLT